MCAASQSTNNMRPFENAKLA